MHYIMWVIAIDIIEDQVLMGKKLEVNIRKKKVKKKKKKEKEEVTKGGKLNYNKWYRTTTTTKGDFERKKFSMTKGY